MPPILAIDGLTKAFGSVRAVDGVGFTVEAGEIYGLLGPNGAGKTTTISMICGLLKPDAGGIRIDGVGLDADGGRARRIMGVVPQELALYEELTGSENLEFWGRLAGLGAAEARVRAREMLEALLLTDRGGHPVRTYSGGMKRRINLGAALMHRPRLLLLDEPTVGIDPQARANILEFVRRLGAEGTAIVYTTHYLEEAEAFCRRVGIVDQGRLLAEGTLAELQARLGGDRVYVLEGALDGARPEAWPGFLDRFGSCRPRSAGSWWPRSGERDPAACLQELLALPVRVENVTLKKPTLNDVFLQLTGRDLRE